MPGFKTTEYKSEKISVIHAGFLTVPSLNQRKYPLYTLGFYSTEFKSEKIFLTDARILQCDFKSEIILIIHAEFIQYGIQFRENTRKQAKFLQFQFKIRRNTRYTRLVFTVPCANQRKYPLYTLGFYSTACK